MVTAADFHQEALGLAGTLAAPHFDRTAYRVARIYASLAPDGQTANLKLTPDQQEVWCALLPDALRPLANKWGLQGWTEVRLTMIEPQPLQDLLPVAWRLALPKSRGRLINTDEAVPR